MPSFFYTRFKKIKSNRTVKRQFFKTKRKTILLGKKDGFS